MSRVFVIPDVHLKPWMFDKATELISKGSYDRIVMLGDLVDDWNQEKNLDLYRDTFEAVYKFIEKFPDLLYCFGNHDVSYKFQAIQSGYSFYARDTVVEGVDNIVKKLPEGNSAYIHRIDNCLFSHAGLTESFVRRYFGACGHLEIDEMIYQINQFDQDSLWDDDSPVWARPQGGDMRLYPIGMMQVVGHTPVITPTLEELYGSKLLSVDNFSTTYMGKTIGDQKFVWVDTEEEVCFELL